MAITGLSYKALEFGPVPERWDRVYSQFDEMTQEPRSYNEREGIVLVSDAVADTVFFSEAELGIMDEVCAKFAKYSSSEIAAISHEEKAWLECNEGHRRIPFRYAFNLKAI